jgi:7-carboxy-7-deazaguanine synthase
MYAVKEIYMTLQGEGAWTGRAAVFLRFAGCNLWSGLERDRGSAVCKFCDTDFIGTDGPAGGKFSGADALADAVAQSWDASVGSHPSPQPSPARGARLPDPRPRFKAVLRSTVPSPRNLALAKLPINVAISAGGYGRGEGQDEGRLSRIKPYVVCTGGEPLLQLGEPLIAALHARGFEIAIETNGTQAAPAGIDWICVSPKANAPLVLTSGDELKLVFPQEGAEPPRFEGLDYHHFFLQPMDGPELRANIEAAVRYCLRHPQWRLSLQTHKLIGLP